MKNHFQKRTDVHFNNAGMAPLPMSVADIAHQMINDQQNLGAQAATKWIQNIPIAREAIASFIGATSAEIVFTQNCAHGLSQVALGFPLTKQDTVITIDQEYASNYFPWVEACKRSGALLKIISSDENFQVPLERILSAIIPGVKLVALSWVQFQTGAVMDLKTIGDACHRVGAKLIVDGIQGVGQLPISFSKLPIDALVFASHKWMCAPLGQGILAVKEDLMQQLNPLIIGSGTFHRWGQSGDPEATMADGFAKFEAGAMSLIPLFCLAESCRIFQKVGVENIAQDISRLTSLLREGLLAHGIDLVTPLNQQGGITSFRMSGDDEARLLQMCAEKNIIIIKRGPVIRTSVHGYNTIDEVQRFLDVVAAVTKSRT